ncbi:MAG: hypothetical protein HY071_05470 [Chloroflexi bacterium]|nr:hypothetical protein [Chloroflexota bacterium]
MGLGRWLRGLRGRSAAAQLELDRAVAAVDRELAANLELSAMFDATHQAFVLENGAFAIYRATMEREIPAAFALTLDVYLRIPDAESAMERRGPANSLRDTDRAIVEGWEGDAREAQRALRAAAAERPTAWARLRGR